MSGEDLKRILRGIFFLFVTLLILFLGLLPSDFTRPGLQVSPFLFAWTAAFIFRRPGSVGIIIILLAATQYCIYNDEGLALGALAYLMYALFVHEVRDYLEHQSFIVQAITLSAAYFAIQVLKNLILQVFFTEHYTLFNLLEFTLYFLVSYIVFTGFILLIFGQRTSKQVTPN